LPVAFAFRIIVPVGFVTAELRLQEIASVVILKFANTIDSDGFSRDITAVEAGCVINSDRRLITLTFKGSGVRV
jgi:hypothetical protein